MSHAVAAGPGWTLHPHSEVHYRQGGEEPESRMGGGPYGGYGPMSRCETSSAYSILYGLFCLFLVILFLWLLWALFRCCFGGYGNNCCFSYGSPGRCGRCKQSKCKCKKGHGSGSESDEESEDP